MEIGTKKRKSVFEPHEMWATFSLFLAVGVYHADTCAIINIELKKHDGTHKNQIQFNLMA